MKRKLLIALLALSSCAEAVDQKSLLLGVAIGLGVYTVQKGVVPMMATIGHGTKMAVKGTAKGVKRAVVGPNKNKTIKGQSHGTTDQSKP